MISMRIPHSTTPFKSGSWTPIPWAFRLFSPGKVCMVTWATAKPFFPKASTWPRPGTPTWRTPKRAAIASEARADGIDMLFCPVLDVARDPRWGRVEEDFGEDPYLSGQMGLAYVEGMQGISLATDHTCIAEPKHFAGHGSPESGINTAPVHAGEREVRSIFLKRFEPAVREGHAMGVMAAYNDIDGVPCTGNPWLLSTVLRDEWGFQGFILSDPAPSDGSTRTIMSLLHLPTPCGWRSIPAWTWTF